MADQPMGVSDAPRNVMIMVASGQEQVCGRQHSHCNAGIRETPAPIFKVAGWHGRELGNMADRNASAIAMRVRLPADFRHVVPGWIEVEIEMEVDVEIEPPRELEN